MQIPDANLALALGFTKEIYESIVPISEMKNFVSDRTSAASMDHLIKCLN